MQPISNNQPIQSSQLNQPEPVPNRVNNTLVVPQDFAGLQHYHQQLRQLFATFQPNLHLRVIPSKKEGPSLILTKAGAEKICQFLGLNYTLIPQTQSTIIDYSNNFFCFGYECRLFHNGVYIGNGFGNCNNREKKYASAGFDSINTIDRMAQKRAFIGATLFATGASAYFGQKIQDLK